MTYTIELEMKYYFKRYYSLVKGPSVYIIHQSALVLKMCSEKPNVMHRISFVLKVAKILCILPYYKKDYSKMKLQTSKIKTVISAIFFLLLISVYCLQFASDFNDYLDNRNVKDIKWGYGTVTYLIYRFLQLYSNIMAFLFSLTSCKILEIILLKLAKSDKFLHIGNYYKYVKIYIICYIVLETIIFIVCLFIFFQFSIFSILLLLLNTCVNI